MAMTWQETLRVARDCVSEELFNAPVALRRLLTAKPPSEMTLAEPAPCIDETSIPAWHTWMAASAFNWPRMPAGSWRGWVSRGGDVVSEVLQPLGFAELVQCEVVPDHQVDLQEIAGFAASKSELRDFATIREMAIARCPDWITDISDASLRKLLEHDEIRFLGHRNGGDHFSTYGWDGRLFLSNSGGSHHLAAAQFVAQQLRRPVPLRGPLHRHCINGVALNAIRAEYEMFAVPQDPEFSIAFGDAMRRIKADYHWHTMPRPYEHARAILLSRRTPAARAAAMELRDAGAADLGAHLQSLLARQTSAKPHPKGPKLVVDVCESEDLTPTAGIS